MFWHFCSVPWILSPWMISLFCLQLLSVYTHANCRRLGFSFAYRWKSDKGMLKFHKRLNSGVTATTGLLNIIHEIINCRDDDLWWIYHLYLVRHGNNWKWHLIILGLSLSHLFSLKLRNSTDRKHKLCSWSVWLWVAWLQCRKRKRPICFLGTAPCSQDWRMCQWLILQSGKWEMS